MLEILRDYHIILIGRKNGLTNNLTYAVEFVFKLGGISMSNEKRCGMCECTSAGQWIKSWDGWTCGACMQEMKDMVDFDSQNCW